MSGHNLFYYPYASFKNAQLPLLKVAALYFDKLGPSIDWLRAHDKSWEQIIESASRPGEKDFGF